jgi:quinoprotein glucose dehydrogenase
MTAVLALAKPADASAKRDYIMDPNGPFYGYQLQGPEGLPDPFKPPYGRITAVNLNKGEIAWTAANGNGPRDLPALRGLKLPPLGQQGRAVPLVTKTLLFMGEGGRAGVPGLPPQGGGKMFRAFDKKTGKVLWEVELPGGTTGPPISYMIRGKQYVVVAVGWEDNPGELIALALP